MYGIKSSLDGRSCADLWWNFPSGTEENSLDALREASDTSYFKDKDALWVKVVANGDPGTGAPGGGNQRPGQPLS
jgi:hypothetical protein